MTDAEREALAQQQADELFHAVRDYLRRSITPIADRLDEIERRLEAVEKKGEDHDRS